MKSKDFILRLYSLPQTVFTLKEISLLFPNALYKNLKSQVSYFVKVNKLARIRKGIYAKEGYNPLELTNKIYTPSYISFETTLEREGIIFQHYETIFAASYLSRKVTVGGNNLVYRKIRDNILLNPKGIENKDNYFIASAERAFLDMIFLFKNYHFDNLDSLNWDEIMNLYKIYKSKALEKRVKDYYRIFKEAHA